MLILLNVQVECTAQTPLPRRRARVGGLCGFRSPAERVPARSLKTGRCVSVQGHRGNSKRKRRVRVDSFRRRKKLQAAG